MELDNEPEDLDSNLFYQALQNTFQSVFNIAQNNCSLICCPCNTSLHGVKLDQNFIEMHILNPSPYFKGQFVTSNKKTRRTIQLEDRVIYTLEGFSENFSVKVVAEETAYNKEFKPFTILILERSLFGDYPKKEGISCKKETHSTSKQLKSLTSYEDCKTLLYSFPECQQAMHRVTEAIKRFQTNYMILSEFLSDAASRLAKITGDASKDFTSLLSDSVQLDRRLRENIEKAMESYVLVSVSDKLYPVIRQHCELADNTLHSKLCQLRDMSALQLGVPSHFCCPLPSAVAHMKTIVDLKTPLEKILCLKSTLDSITSDVNDYVKSTQHSLFTDAQHLTSDDLLPIVVFVMCQCADVKLNSDIYYIEYFHSSLSTANQFSFSLVTFKAAVQHALTLTPQLPTKKVTRQVLKKCEMSETCPEASRSNDTVTHSVRGVDKQLDRVLRQFDSSMKQLQQVDHLSSVHSGPTRKKTKEKQEEQSKLGDFLSSLQDDVGSSYGRQT